MNTVTVPGSLDSLETIRNLVLDSARYAGLDKRSMYRLVQAVDEIATNIIVHGYEETNTVGMVFVDVEINDNELIVIIEDTSVPFDPRQLAPPDNLDASMEDRGIGGLGIYLALREVDAFDYEYVDGKNRNVLVMNISAAT